VFLACAFEFFNGAPVLAPLRNRLATDMPLQCTRVYELPASGYFDPRIHVAKGLGGSTCPRHVDQMPITWRVNTLYMKWCLECHRAPQRFVRPQEKIYDMNWQPSRNQLADGLQLVAQHKIDTSGRLTNCGTCHR